MELADTLVYLRKRAGLSQEELAAKIDVSRSAVGMIESGKRMPGRETLEAIADTFNVSTDFLIGRVDTGEYSKAFRENLRGIIENSSKTDLEACGVNLYMAGLIVDGTVSLSFEYACELSDQLGKTLDEIVNKKDPALMAEYEVDAEIIQRLAALSPDKLQAAAQYIRFLSESEDK